MVCIFVEKELLEDMTEGTMRETGSEVTGATMTAKITMMGTAIITMQISGAPMEAEGQHPELIRIRRFNS